MQRCMDTHTRMPAPLYQVSTRFFSAAAASEVNSAVVTCCPCRYVCLGVASQCKGGTADERPASWSKILAVQHYLKDADWVMWLDADTIVTNPGQAQPGARPCHTDSFCCAALADAQTVFSAVNSLTLFASMCATLSQSTSPHLAQAKSFR